MVLEALLLKDLAVLVASDKIFMCVKVFSKYNIFSYYCHLNNNFHPIQYTPFVSYFSTLKYLLDTNAVMLTC